MRLSQAVADVMHSFSTPTQAITQKPKEWLRDVFKHVMAYASVRNISGGKQTGSTYPLFGEKEYANRIDLANASKENQFPSKAKLSDGRHRYFKKHGMLVDRLA